MSNKSLESKVYDLVVGCFTYKVIFQYNPENIGDTNGNDKMIWINTRFDKQIQKDVLIHEILHACLDDCYYFFLDYPNERKQELEEHVVRFISPRLLSVLTTNTWVIEFLNSESEWGKKK